MKKKYVFANIRLPLHVLENGDIEPMTDYISLQIDPCDELPEKPDMSLLNKEINEKIMSFCSFIQPSDKEKQIEKETTDLIEPVEPIKEKIILSKAEIESYRSQKKPISQNSTLKIYRRRSSGNKTAKTYSSS